jgi:hypothetical protein
MATTTEPDAWIPYFPCFRVTMCPKILKERIEAIGFGEVERLEIRDSTVWPWSTTYTQPKEKHFRILIHFKNLDNTRKQFFEGGGVINWWYQDTNPEKIQAFEIRKVGILSRHSKPNSFY